MVDRPLSDVAREDFGRDGASIPETIGPFRIHGRLGKGGMGVVFDASTGDGQRVALKLMRPVGHADRIHQLLARFTREAKILERLDHPSIVRLVDAGNLDGLMYLAMERIEGVSLLAIRRRGPMGFDALVSLGTGLADALAHMHDLDVVHRDIKPANVLIRSGGLPVITDFGISGSDDVQGITRHGDLLGSPGFMSPAAPRGAAPRPASDQFALGRMMFELGATGAPPKLLRNAPLLEVLTASLKIDWERFPKDQDWPKLEAILRRTLASKAQDRFPSGHALRDALAGVSRNTIEDVDTLSEHVEKLQLPSNHAWAMQDNAPTTSERAVEDDLFQDLDKPAGERTPPRPVREKPPREDYAQKPTQRELTPPKALTLEHPSLVQSQDQGRPLSELVQERRPSTTEATSPARPAIAVGPTAPSRLSQERRAILGDDTTEARVVLLNDQIATLRNQLAEARRAAATPLPGPKSSPIPIVAAAAAALIIGLAVGALMPRGEAPAPTITLVPAAAKSLGDPMYDYQGRSGAVPSAQDVVDAKNQLGNADDQLKKRAYDRAKEYLRFCIEIADLPECHKRLATILALEQHPSARTHLEHYLRIAPSAPDAEEIRKRLDIDDG